MLRGGRRERGGQRAIFKATSRVVGEVGSDAAPRRAAPLLTSRALQTNYSIFTAAAASEENMQGGSRREEMLDECFKD